MLKPTKAIVTITIHYDQSETVNLLELQNLLSENIHTFIGNGGLTGETDLILDTFDVNIDTKPKG